MKKYAVKLIRQVTQTCVVNTMAENGIDAVDTAIASLGVKDWQETDVGETFYRRVTLLPEACPNCDVPYDADVEDHKDCAQCNRLAPDTMPHGEDENCSTCGARPGETHPNGCADHIESKEKNIETRIYTYDVELDISYDGEDLVSSCFISKTRGGMLYCSSLAFLDDQGTIEGDNWSDVIQVPSKIIDKIHSWAEENGY